MYGIRVRLNQIAMDWKWRSSHTSPDIAIVVTSCRLPRKLQLLVLVLYDTLFKQISNFPIAASRQYVSHSAEPHGGSCWYDQIPTSGSRQTSWLTRFNHSQGYRRRPRKRRLVSHSGRMRSGRRLAFWTSSGCFITDQASCPPQCERPTIRTGISECAEPKLRP
jgi:hypothetical protein